MKTNLKRLFSLFLVLAMLGAMLPAVYADEPAAEPVELTDEDYAIVNDVFARIDAMEEAPAKKSANRTQITDAAAEIVMASENYVEGSLERNGNSFTWWTDEGIRCIYNPYMREKYANMRAPENAEEGGIYNEPKATKGGWPSSNQVYLVAPYYGIDDSFTDQYKNEAKSIASAIGDTDGYTLYSGTSVTVDKVADAIESGAVVIFDSHGTTDYDGSYVCDDPDGYEVYDYVSQANYSYLCLTSKSGLTTEDYNDGATYFTDSDGYMCACVNGAAIANHMDSNSPAGILWMAICLGMATDTMCAPMREKGVEVVYGYSQSVTFAGDYCFEETFWDNMIAGKNVATSIAAMKSKWGNWDWSEPIAASYGYSGSGYTLSEARKYRSAFPIVVSDEDTHPGQRDSGTNYGACSEQTVKSTYTLFSQYSVTAKTNNAAYGTVSVSGNVITAKPANGYFAQGYTVTNGTATVEQNGNTFIVNASSDCTVQINFAAKTAVTVNFSGANVSGQTGYAGDSMSLPTAEAPEGFKFLGWMTAPLSSDTTEKPNFYTDSFIPTGNTTLYALYSYVDETSGGGSGDYVKVTETPDDWSGEYLIVYEAGSRVFDGSLSTLEAVSNYQDVTITDNTISAEEADAYKFIIAAMDGGYSVQSASGLYISGTSGSNKLNAGSSAAANTISIDASGNADIVSNTSHLRYNATSGQDRFRYYRSTSYSGQKDIALYVKDGSAGITYYTTSPVKCDHTDTSVIPAVAATCTEVGYTAGVQCDDCSSILSGCEVIAALGHSWSNWNETTKPGCETAGQKTRTCSACGETETQSVAATGHSMSAGSVTTAATCTEDGIRTYTCTTCGNTTTETIPATGHSYTQNGLVYTCGSCGDSYEVPASTTLEYVFSDYTAGTQYAEGEDHTLDDVVTLTINGAHLNGQIRLYAGSNAVFASTKVIDSITVKAGYKADTLNVYGSTDGETWELISSQETSSSYSNYSFDMPAAYNYVMLESVGAQIRVSEMTMVVLESVSTDPEETEPDVSEPTEGEENLVKEWGVTLADDISLNFVMKLDEGDAVAVTVDGNAVTANPVANADGTYTVTIHVAAVQMTDEIVISVNGEALEKTYSVRKYADLILADSTKSDCHELVKNMLVYGGTAQTYFGYNTGNLASKDITVEAKAPEGNADAKVTGNLSGLTYSGATLVHRNKIAVRIYFTGSVEGLNFTANGKACTPVFKNGMYYVEIADINPQELDKDATVTVTSGTQTMTVSYSPLTYMIRMYNKAESTDATKAMVQALYGYYLAAEDYTN